MTTRGNLSVVLVLLASLWFASPTPAFGHPRGWRVSRTRSHRSAYSKYSQRTAPAAHSAYRSPWPRSYYDYPKYTGAFHARYFEELPSIYGTRPMRGTAW